MGKIETQLCFIHIPNVCRISLVVKTPSSHVNWPSFNKGLYAWLKNVHVWLCWCWGLANTDMYELMWEKLFTNGRCSLIMGVHSQKFYCNVTWAQYRVDSNHGIGEWCLKQVAITIGSKHCSTALSCSFWDLQTLHNLQYNSWLKTAPNANKKCS